MGCRADQAELPSACNDRALEIAAIELEREPAASATMRALDTLAEVCPTIPPGIVRGLRASYGEHERATDEPLLLSDLNLAAEHRKICTDLEGWRRVLGMGWRERDAALYDVCELGRYELLDPGEPFREHDLLGFVLYEWLTRNRVSPTIARRFARGLMHATTAPELARERCDDAPHDYACVLTARADGIELPRSSSPWLAELPASISISTSSLAIHGETTAALVAGRFAEPDLDGYLVRPVQMPLVPAWPIVTQADRKVEAGALLRVVYTLKRRDHALLVEGSADARLVPLQVPERWRGETSRDPPELEARVDRTHIHITRHGEAHASIPLEDHEAIENAARALAEQTSRRIIALHVADDLPVEGLVSALDALRGNGCIFIHDSTHNCALWATVDFDPPAPRRPGDWSQLELSLIKQTRKGRRAPSWLAQHRAAVEAAIPRIRACLRHSAIARSEMPEWIAFLFAVGEDGEVGMRPAMPDVRDDELSACLSLGVGDYPALPLDAEVYSVELAVELPG
jgi:hypothetical protein